MRMMSGMLHQLHRPKVKQEDVPTSSESSAQMKSNNVVLLSAEVTTIESIDDDSILNILLYSSPIASAKLGMCSKKWRDKIFLQMKHAHEGECSGDSILASRLWKSFAINRWGNRVALANSSNDDDYDSSSSSSIAWYEYYKHRCSSSWELLRPALQEGVSHLDLIQEQYAHDPYRLLTACILCSRTSGGPTIRKVVHDFLEKYSNPTSVIDADITIMARELHPLGLNRERVMRRFAKDFLRMEWTGGDVTALHGCGAFAASSFAVFCRGEYKRVMKDKKADKNVKVSYFANTSPTCISLWCKHKLIVGCLIFG